MSNIPRFSAEASLYKKTEGFAQTAQERSLPRGKVTPASIPSACSGYCDAKYSPLDPRNYVCWWYCVSGGILIIKHPPGGPGKL